MKSLRIPAWLGLVLAAAVLILLLRTCKAPKGQVAEDTRQDSVTYWRTKHDQQVASILISEVQTEQAKRYADSLAKLLGVKPKYIKEAYSVIEYIRDTIQGKGETLITRDTSGNVTALSEVFASPYYSIMATIQTSGIGSEALVEIYDTLTVVKKKVRNGTQLDFMLANPHAKISGVKSYFV
jgi:hypothetical protein